MKPYIVIRRHWLTRMWTWCIWMEPRLSNLDLRSIGPVSRMSLEQALDKAFSKQSAKVARKEARETA